MNIIWAVLICASVIFAVATGKTDIFTKTLFDAGKSAVEVSLFLAGIISLWLGITKIIEDSGLIHRISKLFRPVISRLFKNIPPDHPSITSITLNILANLFGLGNAATPFGIKAMQDLQTLNKDPETITFEMMIFIVINTASIQLIPFTVIGILATFGAVNPSAVVLPTLLTTACALSCALGVLFVFRKVFK